jgi:hypothetical protein
MKGFGKEHDLGIQSLRIGLATVWRASVVDKRVGWGFGGIG